MVSKYADQDHETSGLIHLREILDQHAGMNLPHVVVTSSGKKWSGADTPAATSVGSRAKIDVEKRK